MCALNGLVDLLQDYDLTQNDMTTIQRIDMSESVSLLPGKGTCYQQVLWGIFKALHCRE